MTQQEFETEFVKDVWDGCYNGSWKDHIVPEAFSHPAKMSYRLLSRILSHIKDEGWATEGSIIVDPFGGIGSTGILGAYGGYQVVCCELEQKFVDLAEQNFKLHDNAWRKLDCPRPVMIQGDSRQLSEIIGRVECIVTSPPYTEEVIHARPSKMTKGIFKGRQANTGLGDYGQTPGQLGAMKPGSVDAVVASPPFQGARSGTTASAQTSGGGPCAERVHTVADGDRLGQTDGNLASMKPGSVDAVVASPPYAAGTVHGGNGIDKNKLTGNQPGKHSQALTMDGYGSTPGNIAALPPGQVSAIISSPPWQNSQEGAGKAGPSSGMWKGYKPGFKDTYESSSDKYGQSQDNLGNSQGDTFWGAARQIVQQCHQILKPGGVAIWVVKDFVRNKKRVDFSGDWRKLCEAAGFVTLHEHHAMLVKEEIKDSLFGHKIVKRKERKSFFRRLAESKGSPAIDYEVVLCTQK